MLHGTLVLFFWAIKDVFIRPECVYSLPRSLILIARNKPKLHNIIMTVYCKVQSPLLDFTQTLIFLFLVIYDPWNNSVLKKNQFYNIMDEHNNNLHNCVYFCSFNRVYVKLFAQCNEIYNNKWQFASFLFTPCIPSHILNALTHSIPSA